MCIVDELIIHRDPVFDEARTRSATGFSGWSDQSGSRVFFGAGSLKDDPLTNSFLKAMRQAEDGGDFYDDNKEDDPFHLLDGMAISISPYFMLYHLYADPQESEISAQDLRNHLFGTTSKPEWFPYPDKAVPTSLIQDYQG